MPLKPQKSVAVITAHPDDETLWAGGTLLSHPGWSVYIVCLSRKNDVERAAKFFNALKILKSDGIMGDLDDGPDQEPLDEKEVQGVILELLPDKHFDLVISHSPSGEYTRHRRHEETGKAVIKLWHNGKISADELWVFAYHDANKAIYPKAIGNAGICNTLTKRTWDRKYRLITETYGFEKNSWEAETTPKEEAFRQFTDAEEAKRWIKSLKV
jgi:LmbE family N-acetylglucosaminyl deacetylase